MSESRQVADIQKIMAEVTTARIVVSVVQASGSYGRAGGKCEVRGWRVEFYEAL